MLIVPRWRPIAHPPFNFSVPASFKLSSWNSIIPPLWDNGYSFAHTTLLLRASSAVPVQVNLIVPVSSTNVMFSATPLATAKDL